MEETLGRRIRRARLHRDITQKDLAELVGISRNAMNKLEKGETLDPRMSHLRKIADVLGVSMDYLAGRKEDNIEREEPFPELVYEKKQRPPARRKQEVSESAPVSGTETR